MEKWQRNIKDRFFLDRPPEPTKRGVRVHVRTQTGVKILCGPKWAINIQRYLEGGRTVYEAWIDNWLTEKTGVA